MDLWTLSAAEAARMLRDGETTSVSLVASCLERIELTDPAIEAWAHLDPDHALAAGRLSDARRRDGADLGPLHGVPVGMKDIVDTWDMPTECGTPLMAGRQPGADAHLVALLREAGAVVIGKTVTTELAVYAPGKTRNPHDEARTPGGSSSGSAAAVAAGQVPLAVGTQTNGSVIRPAAYCGVYGFKPSFGRVSRHGVLAQSPPLDTVGVMGRTVEDVALLAEALTGYDERDSATRLRARPRLWATAREPAPVEPLFAFVRTPAWEQAESDVHDGFAELVEHLGGRCEVFDLPEGFGETWDDHRTIMCADLAKSFAGLYEQGRDVLSETLRAMIEEGQAVTAVAYNRALDRVRGLAPALDRIFDRYDALLTPATTGEAPVGLESTGSPVFCTPWTLLGAPALTAPLLTGSNEMPVGVQIVGRREDDARLLRSARWLVERVDADE
jgi:Asp-tRNA(Asn)/Glu-tRNA(Gln) amidotransferase A subunit family amidase